MISLAPVRDKNKVKSVFTEKGIEFTENSGCVTAMQGDELLGFSLYDLDSKRMVVKYLEPLSDIGLADGILRSTLHVAAERSIMDAFYAETLPEDFLNKIGFIKDETERRLDIDKLFKSCSNCGK